VWGRWPLSLREPPARGKSEKPGEILRFAQDDSLCFRSPRL
jgi:hypothetical protein